MAIEKTKTDPNLGAEINQHLFELGLETPLVETHYSNEDKIRLIKENFRTIMKVLGLDLNDDSLMDTPNRVAKMLVTELNWGLNYDNFPKCTVVDNKMEYDEMVVEKCSVNSTCEHHFVYFGSLHNNNELGCWVGYIPKDKVLGLSKLSRIVEFFAARPQIQERLTEQVSATLRYILNTDDVAVVVKAQHFCVLTRGVKDSNSYTVTSKLSGLFKNEPIVRKEFLSLTR